MMFDLTRWVSQAFGLVGGAAQMLTILSPLVSSQTWLNTLAALGALTLLAVVAGIAVGSLSSLLVASLALYLLLTDVFGLTVEFVPA